MRVILAFSILALIYTIRDIGLVTLGTYLRKIGWWWFAVIPMEVLCTVLDGATISAFASPEKIKLRHTLLAQLSGRAVNAVTPSGNLGEVVKMSVLTDFVSPSRAVSTILLYNIVSFSAELLIIAVAVPVAIVLVPMPSTLLVIMVITAVVCLGLAVGMFVLVKHGMVTSVARLGLRLRILSQARYEKWEARLQSVDDKLRLVGHARRRDRWMGIAFSFAARLNSMALSLLILHAVGRAITPEFVSVWVVGSFAIYFASTLVPMGIGISEGGYAGLFRSIGENPARGVTLVIARRTVTVCYAAVGLLLVTFSETVKRAKAKHAEKAAEHALAPAPHAMSVNPLAAVAPVPEEL